MGDKDIEVFQLTRHLNGGPQLEPNTGFSECARPTCAIDQRERLINLATLSI